MNDFLEDRDDERGWRLSLHHLCALDVSPAKLVTLAAGAGCRHVCLFTHVPEAARRFYPMVQAHDISALADHMSASGVSLCNLEVFPLDGRDDPSAFEEALRVGAALGATRATAHIHDADIDTATTRFEQFCAMAAHHGIIAGLEFNAFSAVKDILYAASIVQGAGQPNGELVCDTLHLVRSGGTAADVAAVAGLIGYVQISDGPATISNADCWSEAIRQRALPGEGDFPIVEIMQCLGRRAVIEIEVPQDVARKAGVGPEDRVRRAVAATRAVLAKVPPARIAS